MTAQTIHPELKKLNVSIIDAGACFYWVHRSKNSDITSSGRYFSSWEKAHLDAMHNFEINEDSNNSEPKTIHPELKKLNVFIFRRRFGQGFYWSQPSETGSWSGSLCDSWEEAHQAALEKFKIVEEQPYDFESLTEVFNDAVRPKTHIHVTISMPLQHQNLIEVFGKTYGLKIEKIEIR